jgi:flagellar motor switch protein FliN/FliY
VAELNELHLSAVSEAMNQMMGSSATSMSTLINKTINIAPPQVEIVNIAEDGIKFLDPALNKIALVKFNMQIEGLIDSKLVQIIPLDFAKEMAISLIGNIGSSPSSAPAQASKPQQDSYSYNEQQVAAPASPQTGYQNVAREEQRRPQENVNVSPAEFQQLDYNMNITGSQNLDLILDVALNVSVELGRTQKTVKEILDFSTGSIIELNKLAGEAVDLMINGKLFAKGEVVVIDENFGVRILDIVSPIERVKKLQ